MVCSQGVSTDGGGGGDRRVVEVEGEGGKGCAVAGEGGAGCCFFVAL